MSLLTGHLTKSSKAGWCAIFGSRLAACLRIILLLPEVYVAMLLKRSMKEKRKSSDCWTWLTGSRDSRGVYCSCEVRVKGLYTKRSGERVRTVETTKRLIEEEGLPNQRKNKKKKTRAKGRDTEKITNERLRSRGGMDERNGFSLLNSPLSLQWKCEFNGHVKYRRSTFHLQNWSDRKAWEYN